MTERERAHHHGIDSDKGIDIANSNQVVASYVYRIILCARQVAKTDRKYFAALIIRYRTYFASI